MIENARLPRFAVLIDADNTSPKIVELSLIHI